MMPHNAQYFSTMSWLRQTTFNYVFSSISTVTGTVTCIWFFQVFYYTKVTNNAGPKFMCLSSSLFVTYFLAVYQKPTSCSLHFPSLLQVWETHACPAVRSRFVLFKTQKVKPYPFPCKPGSCTILNVLHGPWRFIWTAFQYFMNGLNLLARFSWQNLWITNHIFVIFLRKFHIKSFTLKCTINQPRKNQRTWIELETMQHYLDVTEIF